ncbi:histidine kinase [Verminephrobacter aporrectodeae subsp. tuberculatae]|uniref:sensor histidine kinase n=1 Tax=Verminephrobacter aporrectodeae TaxID=1110389 RepID=UPI002244AC69|nr:CHASE3 domain-containing protein [Verminephrobacter aporrectodeae]MCW8163693.1 histidine kinase [Verminephrobacter aporrectodeae subsp. tuberculatae]MCW8168437.1 histidine kinase [Verminephrobacter aporrectodeae subsp. tuberculatae]
MHPEENPRRWLSRVRKMARSLPMVLLAAMAVLVGINETGHLRSQDAVGQMALGRSTHSDVSTLLQSMLDAETGQRGYLLTGDETYLAPYDLAISTVQTKLDRLRQQFVHAPEDMQEFGLLSQQIACKLAEMELSLRLRRQGNIDAWKFILNTDMGKECMQAIHQHALELIQRSDRRVQNGQRQIEQSLMLSRIGIATVTVIGLLAFSMYLRQARALQAVNQREQELLERERDRLEGLVRERTATLSALANHLQQVREEERGHLARELHDELGALLTAAKLDVARLKSKIDATPPDVAERLRHLTETLNSGIALKRRIIEDLRPSSLSNLGLSAAIEILTRECAERAGIEVETSLESVQLPEATQLTVYRMVQEALTNIGKYAKARRVLVSVHSHPRHVAVQVRDDGLGFDPVSVRLNSHGLAGMRHRVEAAGGRLSIASRPGGGTLVSAILPLEYTPGTPPALQGV